MSGSEDFVWLGTGPYPKAVPVGEGGVGRFVASQSPVVVERVGARAVVARQSGEELALVELRLAGKVNRSPESVGVTFLLTADGAAAVVSRLVDVASGQPWGEEFASLLEGRLAALAVDENGGGAGGGQA